MGRIRNSSATLRRGVAIGTGMVVAVAALFPLAAYAGSSTHSNSTTTATPGAVSNVTKALSARWVDPGDMISSGWAISMSGQHPAATVEVTNIVATIPLKCQIDDHATLLNLVLHLPDASQSFTANETAWHPTASPADVHGYQASARAGDLCQDGTLVPNGNATYTAKLVSADTTDPFAMRFHTVDARTNQTQSRSSNQVNPNTDCASTSQNSSGASPCNAAWTPQTKNSAAAAPAPAGSTGSGSGTGSGSSGSGSTSGVAPNTHPQNPGKGIIGTVTGIVSGTVGTVTTLHAPLTLVTGALNIARGIGAEAHRTQTAGATPPPAGLVSGATSQPAPAPVLVLPAPSQSTVLGPVPLMVPVIDGVAAGVGGALPWKWFALLAILDLGLIVGIVIRRRYARSDRLKTASSPSEDSA